MALSSIQTKMTRVCRYKVKGGISERVLKYMDSRREWEMEKEQQSEISNVCAGPRKIPKITSFLLDQERRPRSN